MRVWIEINTNITVETKSENVTLRVRVWIEIPFISAASSRLPVTLRVRVWIEILSAFAFAAASFVTLRVRVWIEISVMVKIRFAFASPSV